MSDFLTLLSDPYRYTPIVPAFDKKVGLRKYWEANRDALDTLGISRDKFMDYYMILREDASPLRHEFSHRWLNGWVNDGLIRNPKEMTVQYVGQLGYKIFGVKLKDLDLSKIDPYGLLSHTNIEEEVPTFTPVETPPITHAVPSSVYVKIGALSITLEPGGSLHIGEYEASEMTVEGRARVTVTHTSSGKNGLRVLATV